MTTVSSGTTESNLVIASGGSVLVAKGGTLLSATIDAGGSATISVGGTDSATTISAGGVELVLGAASGDIVAGTQDVGNSVTSSGSVSNETILAGGLVLLAKGTTASNTLVDAGGSLTISGGATATNVTLDGGTLALESPKATIAGSLVFSGAATLAISSTVTTSAGAYGDQAVISGFGAGDAIDLAATSTIGSATSTIGSATNDTLSVTTSAGNTVATVSGSGGTESFLFSGTSIGASLALISDGVGGEEIVSASAATTLSSGVTSAGVTVASGAFLTVLSGGTASAATVLSGGSATIASGGLDSATTLSSGGVEHVYGSARGDSVEGTQVVSGGSVASETVGGTLLLSGASTATDIDLSSGGTAILASSASVLSGSFTFDETGTLEIAAPASATADAGAVISGFYYDDTIALEGVGSGATLSTTTSNGLVVATVSSAGTVVETLEFAGIATSNVTLTDADGTEELTYAGATTLSAYTAGDLVISISGNGSGAGYVGDNQASAITLEELTTDGTVVGEEVLPQTTTTVDGVTEYAISGEYGSSSEGLLQLSGDGQSLTIAGYGITATSFNVSDAASLYGTTALAQTTSIQGGQYIAVARVIADISYDGTIDTSTALYDVDNTNNPRSVVTINGTSFYLSGQGSGNDGTEGVFVAADGASSATSILTGTDTRDIEIVDDELYVSVDSKLNNGGGIDWFGTTLPTGTTSATVLAGLSASVTLSDGNGNSVNAGTGTVNLSPEQYFFANATTLYVADAGTPKEGGLGDGGLQKWSLVDGTWVLDYTLSTGLDLVANTATSGTTGLIGLTGVVNADGTVTLYATNETVGDTDQTYLYEITDTLADTTAASASGESFTVLETASAGTRIRGVSFAPSSSTSATTGEVTSALVLSGGTSSAGLTVASGGTVGVASGAHLEGATLLSGAALTISAGGSESASYIAHGASASVLGSTSGDTVAGAQTLSGASETDVAIENGGVVTLTDDSVVTDATVYSGGTLVIGDPSTADGTTVISGGTVTLATADATLSGTVTFATSGTLEVEAISDAGAGDQAEISDFGATDLIEVTVMGSGTTLTTSVSGTEVIATLSSGGASETFLFAGSGTLSGAEYAEGLGLTISGGVAELTYTPPTPTITDVAAGVTSSGLTIGTSATLDVASGGTISAITVAAGGSAVIAIGGTDLDSVIEFGGTEIVSGTASGDEIWGTQLVSATSGSVAASVSNETVESGGVLDLFLKPDTATDITIMGGGTMVLNGNVTASNVTLETGALLELVSPKAVLAGSLVFDGAATIEVTSVSSASLGYEGEEVISGWQSGDAIDMTTMAASAATLALTTSGGNAVATVTSGTITEEYVFAGTSVSSTIALTADANGDAELTYEAACFCPGTRIAAEGGEVAVETLRPGDCVRTTAGALEPIVWIGRRRVDPPSEIVPLFAAPHPIRILAGALGEGLPRRDLRVSPRHALLVDGVLIQAGALVNGVTILREPTIPESFVYYHIELDTHALILAEGAPAETFVDNVGREAFDNWAEHQALRADTALLAEMDLPLASSARQVPLATRLRLASLAGKAAA